MEQIPSTRVEGRSHVDENVCFSEKARWCMESGMGGGGEVCLTLSWSDILDAAQSTSAHGDVESLAVQKWKVATPPASLI